MLTAEEIQIRRAQISAGADLGGLLASLEGRARTVRQRNPAVPAGKGMLTVDGGLCPQDHVPLHFDPWSPRRHRCPRCGGEVSGGRHDQRWCWLGHLWCSERIAESAAVGVLGANEAALEWAGAKVREYGDRYFECPNADNILGPSRLFFSTYLESIWLTGYLAGAWLLREAGALDASAEEAAVAVAEEAAGLIGEYDEGLSNRQTWNNAALAAVAVWLEDEALARRAVEGPGGLVGHLVDGFRLDGMWYEGENYHLFALRGLLVGADWARLAGVDLFAEAAASERLRAALLAPVLSALPDVTFPARKDARFGVSLAQPMYLELWERGVALLEASGRETGALTDWLRTCYALPAPAAALFDSYLHEAGEAAPAGRSRRSLSWWMLCTMMPDLPPAAGERSGPGGVFLEHQGLAILRPQGHYISLEGGGLGGGHGHADRLHLTLHAGGVHWLADPGTGSYVSPDLFWYRATLAHNAPRLDGRSQPPGDARVETFDVQGEWGWVRGRFEGFTRTVVGGPSHLVDLVEWSGGEGEHLVELAWHPAGAVSLVSPGRWEAVESSDPLLTDLRRFIPQGQGAIRWEARVEGRTLTGLFDADGELLLGRCPPRPGEPGAEPGAVLLRRLRGRYVRFGTVLGYGEHAVEDARFGPSEVTVRIPGEEVLHRLTTEGWEVHARGHATVLRGQRRVLPTETLRVPDVSRLTPRDLAPSAVASHLAAPPPLDGTPGGFPGGPGLHLDHDDQYRRSEEPYPGPDAFSALAWIGWDEQALYLAVRVVTAEPRFRPRGAAPLLLDNEPDLIHSDGVQIYLSVGEGPARGWLVVPDPDGSELQVRPVEGGPAGEGKIRGTWRRTEEGYGLSVAIEVPEWPPERADTLVHFDLLVNQMGADRQRRLGQLVWSGGGGWVYLRGDRQPASRFGRVLLT